MREREGKRARERERERERVGEARKEEREVNITYFKAFLPLSLPTVPNTLNSGVQL